MKMTARVFRKEESACTETQSERTHGLLQQLKEGQSGYSLDF